SHTEITLDERGLIWDRRWMVVDGDGIVITQRELPAMALIQPRLDDACLHITAPNLPETHVPLEREPGEVWRVEVWGDVCAAWDEGDELADWMSDYLGIEARLVRMADGFVRPVDPTYAPPDTPVGFADGFPLLIVSEASLDELNRHLVERGKMPVSM